MRAQYNERLPADAATFQGNTVSSPTQTGIVTFLFTAIEGSARCWDQHPERMKEALVCHDALVRAAVGATAAW